MSDKTKNRVLFAGILFLYLTASLAVVMTAHRSAPIVIGSYEIPATAFMGVFSSLANVCVIFMVLFFKKPGFIMAILLVAAGYPQIIVNIVRRQNLMSISGLFTNAFTIIAIILIHQRNKTIEEYQEAELKQLRAQHKFSKHLFEQTATALVNAVDAKDEYSHGHSLRVAEYSEKIARMMGKNDEECYKIYYTALLHDVGKIGIDDSIINKKGKLTKEEFDIMKEHPIKGNRILSSVSEYPYLSIGAHYHHERYDGMGYPSGLKGEDIPEVARIITVADAYDAMTSNRSYRDTIPQQLVREEIVKCAGTQFDPEIAKIMQKLIDMDVEYQMKEKDSLDELAGRNDLRCDEYRSTISDGIHVNNCITRIHLRYSPNENVKVSRPPVMVLFDSLDERVHVDEKTVRELNYFEYCEICFDGSTVNKETRKIQANVIDHENDEQRLKALGKDVIYDIEAVKQKDHVFISIDDGAKTVEFTIALPDSSRFVYIGLTGEYCHISEVTITRDDEPVPDDYIKRIAEEISYIDGPVGDVANVQIDGYRTDATEGIPLSDGLSITFHTKSLPTARLIWHCPYFTIFRSRDKKVGGVDFHEYAFIRLDGENWEGSDCSENELTVNRSDAFGGWEAWKKSNKEGFDCTVDFKRDGNVIITRTENFGLEIINKTTIIDGTGDLYVAITGDQTALTDIRINKG